MSRSILLHQNVPDAIIFRDTLATLAVNFEVFVWPDCPSLESVEVAVIWQEMNAFPAMLPNLGLLLVCGSGVDSVIESVSVPRSVPVVRLVDPHIKERVSDYVVMAALNHVRKWDHYARHQKEARWDRMTDISVKPKVGIMGLGLIGETTAQKLLAMGFETCGWVRTRRSRNLTEVYVGDKELHDFARQCAIVICILPLTHRTRGILCQQFFERLPEGAYLINVGRGGHLVDDDLLQALDDGHLSGACLDVFESEPLPVQHPFWSNPRITVTPHIAGGLRPEWQAAHAAEVIYDHMNGRTLKGVVNHDTQY